MVRGPAPPRARIMALRVPLDGSVPWRVKMAPWLDPSTGPCPSQVDAQLGQPHTHPLGVPGSGFVGMAGGGIETVVSRQRALDVSAVTLGGQSGAGKHDELVF